MKKFMHFLRLIPAKLRWRTKEIKELWSYSTAKDFKSLNVLKDEIHETYIRQHRLLPNHPETSELKGQLDMIEYIIDGKYR